MAEEYEIIGRDGLRGDGSWATRLSRVASLVMHPFFMPLYGVLLLVALDVLPHEVQSRMVLMTAVYTMLMPWISLLFLRLVGLVDTMSVNVPRQRILPMLMLVSCYVAFIIAVGANPLFHLLSIVRSFMIGATMCVLSALLVTFWWKISLHLISAGGAVAFTLFLAIFGVGGAVACFMVAVLCAGALATARLHLGSHTPAQVAVGFAVGFVLVAASLIFA